MTSARLKAKLADRQRELKHHSDAFDRFTKQGKHGKARWHRRRIRRCKKAIKKLLRLIKIQEARDARIIDWNGHPALADANVKKCAQVALAANGDLFITATSDGVHTPTSYHYQHMAFDAGSSGRYGEQPEIDAQEALLAKFGAGFFRELFGPAGWYIKNGVKYAGTFPGHGDHLHCAPIPA